MENNIFSLSRFIQLIRRHYVLNYKGLLIGYGAFAVALAIIGALSSFARSEFNIQVFAVLFYVFLFVAGYILSSSVFSELHSPEKSIHFLTLPASDFEKWFSGWLNTSIIYLIFSLVVFYVSYFLSALLALIWFEVPFEGYNIFSGDFFQMSLLYLITQSVFFFGAVYFKRFNFLKTILALFVLLIIYSVYQTLISAVAFREIFMILIHEGRVNDTVMVPGLEEYMENTVLPLIKGVFYFVIPVFFLSLSYIRLKEREV